MLSVAVNSLRITLRLATDGAIAVKGPGIEGGRDQGPLMVEHPTLGRVPAIPGSTLKGAVRAQCERYTKTLGPPDAICDPSHTSGKCLAGGIDKRLAAHQRYLVQCPVCRMFGSGHFGPRIAFSDLYPDPTRVPKDEEPFHEGRRTMVAIDRVLGSVARGALVETTTIEGCEFLGTVTLRNYELSQLGLLMTALSDLVNGWIRLGSAKSRGLGGIRGSLDNVEVAYYGWRPGEDGTSARRGEQEVSAGRLYGVGALLAGHDRDLADRYGYSSEDSQALPDELHCSFRQKGIAASLVYDERAAASLMHWVADTHSTWSGKPA